MLLMLLINSIKVSKKISHRKLYTRLDIVQNIYEHLVILPQKNIHV